MPARSRTVLSVEATSKDGSAPRAARPFLKWAGGKRLLIPHIVRHMPDRYGTYFEPFIGGGALFFHLHPPKAVLADHNLRLVRAYRGVQGSVDWVVSLLKRYPHTKEFFQEMRASDIDARPDAEVAAWLIYLNKTAFNGLYRVNSKNRFNVPFGDYENPNLCDTRNLNACAAALTKAQIENEDFELVVKRAKKGDFVYFDPPYVPLSASSSFTSYTAAGFDMEDQRRLRDVARSLKKRGVAVVLSNSSAGAVRELYEKDFTITEIDAARAINSKGGGRGKVKELVIT